jgi:hypothetical protein
MSSNKEVERTGNFPFLSNLWMEMKGLTFIAPTSLAHPPKATMFAFSFPLAALTIIPYSSTKI